MFRTELSLDQAIAASRELASIVRRSYIPEIVIGIETGGTLPAREIADGFGLDEDTMVIKRDIDLNDIYSCVPRPLRFGVKLCQGILFLVKSPELLRGFAADVKNKRVLLVDDITHTGKTLEIAVDYILRKEPSELKTAAISTLGPHMDFHWSTSRYNFPWSKNSRFYRQFQEYIEKQTQKV